MTKPQKNSMTITTKRLRLVAGTAELTKAAITDRVEFSRLLGARVPEEWPHPILRDAEPYVAEVLAKHPYEAGWWIWYMILSDPEGDVLIGNTGLKGEPTPDGIAEVGYAVLDEFQRQGYATEAVLALMDWAFSDARVKQIVAETLPQLKPSIRVMEKCEMAFVGRGFEKGVVRYRKSRP